MNRNKRLALFISIFLILVPVSSAIAAYSKTFTLTANITLQLPDATPTATPTPEPTPEPTPTPEPSKQVRIVYHAGYFSNDQIEKSAPRKSTITLPDALFERDNYVQVGWSTWPYSSFVEYNFGDTFQVETHTEHFYAVWEYNRSWDDPWSWYPFSSLSDDSEDLEQEAAETPTPEPSASPSTDTPGPIQTTPATEASITPEPAADTPVPTVLPSGEGD